MLLPKPYSPKTLTELAPIVYLRYLDAFGGLARPVSVHYRSDGHCPALAMIRCTPSFTEFTGFSEGNVGVFHNFP